MGMGNSRIACSRKSEEREKVQATPFEKILQLLLILSVSFNGLWLVELSDSTRSPRQLLGTRLHWSGVNGSFVVIGPETNENQGLLGLQNTGRGREDVHIDARLSIDGTVCSPDELKDVFLHLHNIVLIMNINYVEVARKTANFLKVVYGRFFDNIVVIAPEAVPEVGAEARGSPKVRNAWQYAYLHLPKIFARYPNAEGFLWTNDDVVLSYWNLRHTDKDKLWLSDCWGNMIFIPFDEKLSPQRRDGWSSLPWRRRSANMALSHLEQHFIEQYKESLLPRADGYIKRVVDCFYIPRRLVEPLANELIPVFRDYMIMSEIAIPMMFYALENPREYDPVFSNMTYVWRRRHQYDPRKFWRPEMNAFHQWKLAKPGFMNAFVQTLGKRDPCLKLMDGRVYAANSTPAATGPAAQAPRGLAPWAAPVPSPVGFDATINTAS